MTPWNRFHVREYRAPELDEELGGVFPEVRVRGMFGTPTLYETEIARVDGARRRIRAKEEAAKRAATPAARPAPPRRPLPVRIARALVPARVRSWLRTTLAAEGHSVAPAASIAVATEPTDDPMPLERFLEFTVKDLFYADTDLDPAMDFMAVCRVVAADADATASEVSGRSA